MPHDTKSNTGGGTTFTRNIQKALHGKVDWVASVQDADLLFIPGVTLCDRSTFNDAVARQIPIVTRVDNLPEDHRNRGTGISRLRDFTAQSHVVVFQSEWAKHVAGQITGENGVVIYNGVDTSIFKPDLSKRSDDPTFIYVKHSRNECKRFQEAQTLFREYARVNPKAKLIIVGKFDDELPKYNFGFFDDEQIEYHGIVTDPGKLAQLYQRAHVLLFPSYGDACPNVVLEAKASGCRVIFHPWGGTEELCDMFDRSLDYESFRPVEIMTFLMNQKLKDSYQEHVLKNFTLEKMGEEYYKIFRLLCPQTTVSN